MILVRDYKEEVEEEREERRRQGLEPKSGILDLDLNPSQDMSILEEKPVVRAMWLDEWMEDF